MLPRKANERNPVFQIALGLLLALNAPAGAQSDSEHIQFLSALEALGHKKLTAMVIEQSRDYLYQYPDSATASEVRFKLAKAYSDSKKENWSLFANLELIYLHPNSPRLATSQDRVRLLLTQEKKFQPIRDKLNEIVHPDTSARTPEGAHYALIKKFYYYNLKPTRLPLIASCDEFLHHFPRSPLAGEVTFWKGELLAQDGQAEEALTAYLKTSFLHKKSVYASVSKLKAADLMSKSLKMHQRAIAGLREFLTNFPGDPQAPLAQYRIAEINESEMKNYTNAIEAYVAVAKNYPGSVEAVPALFKAAKLYEDKLKDNVQAIEVYQRLVRDFKDDIKAPYALAETGRIYEKRLKDYAKAAGSYQSIYDQYQGSKIAGESLYAAAEINEKKLKNFEVAVSHYRTLVDRYPKTELASRASRRIQKLSKDTGEQTSK